MKLETNVQQLIGTMRSAMATQTEQMMKAEFDGSLDGYRMTPEVRTQVLEETKRLQNDLFDLMTKRMSWAALKPIYLEVYRKNFTTEELRPLVAFFSSVAGQAYVTKTPAIAADSVKGVQDLAAGMMPEIQALISARMASLKEKYSKKP